MLSYAIALATLPQTDPLKDGQGLPRDHAANGSVDMKADRNCFNLTAGCGHTRDRGNATGKDGSRRAGDLRKSDPDGRNRKAPWVDAHGTTPRSWEVRGREAGQPKHRRIVGNVFATIGLGKIGLAAHCQRRSQHEEQNSEQTTATSR